MAVETIRPGYTYKSDTLTANYADNYVQLRGTTRQLKILTTGACEFIINREEDSVDIDGELLANEEFRLDDVNQGLWSVGIRGTGSYRIWAYY